MKIIRFNESKSFKKYHTISDEEIMDICTEMTDQGFEVKIDRKFIGERSDKPTNEPISSEFYPIYDITISKEYDQDLENYRYNGSYLYNELNILKMFTSIVYRLSKLYLSNAFYSISNNRHMIRMVMNKEVTNDLGFDFYHFNFDLNKLINQIHQEYPPHLLYDDEPGYVTNNADMTNFDFSYLGKYNKSYIELMWDKVDEIDNKKEYDPIIKKLKNFLDKYKNNITYKFLFEKEKEIEKMMGSFFNKKKKKFLFYKLYVKVELIH